MKIVIDISDEEYEDVKKVGGCYYDFGKAIYYGTPLPKGHGRLGDLDAIRNKLKELEEYYQAKFLREYYRAEFLGESNVIHESAMNGRLYGFTNAKFIVQDAPTIIEADNAESEVEE